MGERRFDVHEKSYRAIAIKSVSSLYEDTAIPGLKKFQEALNEHGNKDGKPTKISITIHGKKDFNFSFKVENLSEIQEILQWTIGGE